MTKPTLQVRFTISPEEKNSITNLLASLDVETSGGEKKFDDGCDVMPKPIDTLQLKTKGALTKFTIDMDYDDFSSSTAKEVAKFMDEALQIINAKPEINKAPKSDIFYM